MEMLPRDQVPLPLRQVEPEGRLLVRLDRYITVVTRVLFGIAGVGLVAMLVLIVADIIGIKIFSKPIPGGIEYVSFFSVVAIAFAVPFTQVMRGHVAVDFIVDLFPRRAKLVIDIIMALFSVSLFALLAWFSFKYGNSLRRSGEVSMTQEIPFYPFVWGMAVCFVVMLLVVLLDLAKLVVKAVGKWTR
jgi:TRAP-type C4-dicarboxylate transport system permease small subunit